MLANKFIQKIYDPHNAKEHYQLLIRKKKIKSVKQSEIIIHTQKQKQLSTKVTLTIYLNQSILQLYQTYKNFQEMALAGLLI